MIDIIERLRFDAVRCELQFSKGVAGNINDAIDEIERLRDALVSVRAEINLSKAPKLMAKIERALGIDGAGQPPR